jgi:hypothetical protein
MIRERLVGDGVVGRGLAGSPGSDGASPYLGLAALKIEHEHDNEDEHD